MKKRLSKISDKSSTFNSKVKKTTEETADSLLEPREKVAEPVDQEYSSSRVESFSKAKAKLLLAELNRGLAIIEAEKSDQKNPIGSTILPSQQNHHKSAKNSESARKKLTSSEFEKFKADPSSVKNSLKLPETLIEIKTSKSASHSPREKENLSTESVIKVASTAPSSPQGSFIKKVGKQVGSFIKHKTKPDVETDKQTSKSASHSPREKENLATESVTKVANTALSSQQGSFIKKAGRQVESFIKHKTKPDVETDKQASKSASHSPRKHNNKSSITEDSDWLFTSPKGSMIATIKKESVEGNKPTSSLRIKKAKNFLDDLKKEESEEIKHRNSEKVENSKTKSSTEKFFLKNAAEHNEKSSASKPTLKDFNKGGTFSFIVNKDKNNVPKIQLEDRDETICFDDIADKKAAPQTAEIIQLKEKSTIEFFNNLGDDIMNINCENNLDYIENNSDLKYLNEVQNPTVIKTVQATASQSSIKGEKTAENVIQQAIEEVEEPKKDIVYKENNKGFGYLSEITDGSLILKPTVTVQKKVESEYNPTSNNLNEIGWVTRFKDVVNEIKVKKALNKTGEAAKLWSVKLQAADTLNEELIEINGVTVSKVIEE